MIQVSEFWHTQTTQGGTPRLVVESWLGAEQLATLPIVAGSWRVEHDSETTTPGAVSFQVPNTPDWRPTEPGHPLADYGQQLRCSIGWDRADGTAELVPLAVLRLAKATPAGDTITVTGEGLLKTVEDAKFLYPFSGSGSRVDLVNRLLQGILPVVIEVPQASAPACFEEQDRLKVLLDVVDSWPARLWVDDQGTARVSPTWDDAIPGDPVASIEIIQRHGVTLDRDTPGPNAYRVSTIPEGDTEALWSVATINDGPMTYGGPYGYRVGYYSSPLLPNNRTSLFEVATRMCQRSRRRTDAITVQTPPRYELEIGDVVRLDAPAADLTNVLGRITGWAHTAQGSQFKIAKLGA